MHVIGLHQLYKVNNPFVVIT